MLKEKPQWVLIQFGHNDQKRDPEHTDPATSYRENLKTFIREVREGGGKPVLVTSVARRIYVDGEMTTSLTPYVEAAKAVGAEMQVPVIDLHRVSFALFQQSGRNFASSMGRASRIAHTSLRKERRTSTRCRRAGARGAGVARAFAARATTASGVAV